MSDRTHPDGADPAPHAGTPTAPWGLRRLLREVVGWVLVIVGIPLLPLPGPGTLVIVAGVTLLSRNYVWAQRLLEPLEHWAIEAARFGVQTWPRILVGAFGGCWLAIAGALWWMGPDIPTFSLLGIEFGPELPGAGWAVASGLWASAAVAWFLLGYSIWRWRPASTETYERSKVDA